MEVKKQAVGSTVEDSARLQTLNARLEQYISRNRVDDARVATLVEQVEDLNQRLVQEKKRALDLLHKQLDKSEQRLEDERRAKNVTLAELRKSEDQHEQTRRLLDLAKGDLKTLREQHDALEKKLADATNAEGKVSRREKELRAALEAATTARNDKAEAAERFRKERDDLEDKFAALQRTSTISVGDMQKERDDWMGQIERLNKQIAQLKVQRDEVIRMLRAKFEADKDAQIAEVREQERKLHQHTVDQLNQHFELRLKSYREEITNKNKEIEQVRLEGQAFKDELIDMRLATSKSAERIRQAMAEKSVAEEELCQMRDVQRAERADKEEMRMGFIAQVQRLKNMHQRLFRRYEELKAAKAEVDAAIEKTNMLLDAEEPRSKESGEKIKAAEKGVLPVLGLDNWDPKIAAAAIVDKISAGDSEQAIRVADADVNGVAPMQDEGETTSNRTRRETSKPSSSAPSSSSRSSSNTSKRGETPKKNPAAKKPARAEGEGETSSSSSTSRSSRHGGGKRKRSPESDDLEQAAPAAAVAAPAVANGTAEAAAAAQTTKATGATVEKKAKKDSGESRRSGSGSADDKKAKKSEHDERRKSSRESRRDDHEKRDARAGDKGKDKEERRPTKRQRGSEPAADKPNPKPKAKKSSGKLRETKKEAVESKVEPIVLTYDEEDQRLVATNTTAKDFDIANWRLRILGKFIEMGAPRIVPAGGYIEWFPNKEVAVAHRKKHPELKQSTVPRGPPMIIGQESFKTIYDHTVELISHDQKTAFKPQWILEQEARDKSARRKSWFGSWF